MPRPLAADPVAFVRRVLCDPETGRAFELYPAQERFLREALTPVCLTGGSPTRR